MADSAQEKPLLVVKGQNRNAEIFALDIIYCWPFGYNYIVFYGRTPSVIYRKHPSGAHMDPVSMNHMGLTLDCL